MCPCTRQPIANDLRNRAPPLHLGRQPPRLNYPPDAVPDPDSRTVVRSPARTGVSISELTPPRLASQFRSHLSYTIRTKLQHQAVVKVPGSFRPSAGNEHLYSYCNFTEPLVETAPKSLRHSCRSELRRTPCFQGDRLCLHLGQASDDQVGGIPALAAQVHLHRPVVRSP